MTTNGLSLAAATANQSTQTLLLPFSTAVSTLCRLCLKAAKPPITNLEEQPALLQMIRQISKLELKFDQQHPKQMCIECLEKLLNVELFINQCKTSEHRLKQMLVNPSRIFTIANTEIPAQENARQLKFIMLRKNHQFQPVESSQIPITSPVTVQTWNVIATPKESPKSPQPEHSVIDLVEDLQEAKYESADDISEIVEAETEADNSPKKAEPKLHAISVGGTSTEDENTQETLPKAERKKKIARKSANTKIKPLRVKRCPECGLQVNSVLNHRKKNKSCWFKCDQCDCSYSAPNHLESHQKSVHTDHKYICEICSAAYKYNYSLQRHLRMHKYGREFTCHECGKQFASKYNLDEHINLHTNATVSKCPYCDKTFLHKARKSKHITAAHPEYRRKSRQEGFDNSHSPILLRQPNRPLTFRTTPKGDREYKCKICNRGFNKYVTMWAHVKTHSGIRYKCPVCPFAAVRPAGLAVHKRIHTGLRPFQCSLCEKAFKQSNQLNYHLMIHRNEKKFACKLCGKAFVLKHNLQEHELRHKKIRPFLCHVCCNGFYSSSARKKHVLTAHGQQEVDNIRKHTWKIDVKIAESDLSSSDGETS